MLGSATPSLESFYACKNGRFQILELRKRAGAGELPAVYVVDKNGVHQYDIFAAYEVGVQEIVYRGDVEQSGLQKQFLDFAARRSVISTGIAPQKDDQILTLSTCTGRVMQPVGLYRRSGTTRRRRYLK